MLKPIHNQAETVEHLINCLHSKRTALDASDTGVGKTYVALMTAKKYGRPFGVVCSKAGIGVWEKVIHEAELNPMVKFVYNYEKLRTGKTEVAQLIGKKKSFKWDEDLADDLIIFDEVHRCKGRKTLQADLLIGAKTLGATTLLLSATAAINPLDMRSIGYALNLHGLVDFYAWAAKNGARQLRIRDRAFWSWGPQKNENHEIYHEHLRALHEDIFPSVGVRVRKKDIPGFPETQIAAEACSFAGAIAVCKDLKEKIDQIELDQLDLDNELGFIQMERRRLELVKVEGIVEKTKDMVKEGNSVAIFVNFRDTLAELSKRLKTDCVVQGDQDKSTRDENIAKFQADEERIIILNSAAGGESISLHDINGRFPRVALISPTWNAVQLKQIFGRVHRQGAKTKSLQVLLFAAESIEEAACDAVSAKLDNIDLINDGDLQKGFIDKPEVIEDNIITMAVA